MCLRFTVRTTLIIGLGYHEDRVKSTGATSGVIASEAKHSIAPQGRVDCFVAEPVIGRAFARPGGSSQ